MWWVIILAIITYMLFCFFSDRKNDLNQIKQVGGVRKKYSTLVNSILSSDPSAKIMNETSDSITIGSSGSSGSTLFFINQVFGNVVVEYKVKSMIFGNSKLSWEFNADMDQNEMLRIIVEDVQKNNLKIMSKFS